jgi:hypothetical protein
MAITNQWQMQETSGTTAIDAVSGENGQYIGTDYQLNQAETWSTNPNVKSVLFEADTGSAPFRNADAYINLLSSSFASGLTVSTVDSSAFIYFKPPDDNTEPFHNPSWNQSGMLFYLSTDSTTIPAVTLRYSYADENIDPPTPEGKQFYAQFADGTNSTVNLSIDLPKDENVNPWYIVGVTWSNTRCSLHAYSFGTTTWTHVEDTSTPWAWPSDTFDDAKIGTTALTSAFWLSGNVSHATIFDTALTDTEIEAEDFEPEVVIVTTPACQRTIPLHFLRTMWDITESTMTCTAIVQTQDGVGSWIDQGNVKCNLELTGTKRELDSSNNWKVLQTWVVYMSGRYTLPSPAANTNIRFLVSGLTLQSYQYYQSPDDIVTTVECERI